jgi:hypothetical protein
MKYVMLNPLILAVGVILVACSAVVPLASSDMDAEAKLFKKIPDKANIYVIHTVPYVQRLHDVSIDGGVRISLAARTYTVFSVAPGLHTIAVYSTENRELMKLEAQAGSMYFIDMGWKMGSGTGDVKATVGLMSEVEGKEKIKSMHLVSADGY